MLDKCLVVLWRIQTDSDLSDSIAIFLVIDETLLVSTNGIDVDVEKTLYFLILKKHFTNHETCFNVSWLQLIN